MPLLDSRGWFHSEGLGQTDRRIQRHLMQLSSQIDRVTLPAVTRCETVKHVIIPNDAERASAWVEGMADAVKTRLLS